jgi:archaellum biogenesis ATPase FlaH
LDLASALIKRVLECEDFDTWTNVRKHYLPVEYHKLHEIINKHSDTYHKLPSFEDLKFETRDAATLEKVYALETSEEVDTEPFLLLDYLKNEYAQKEALFHIDKFIDTSLAFETAEETISHIQQIAADLELKVDVKDPAESMQKINLFESEEDLGNRVTLGLNEEFDANYQITTTDYVMVGGEKGSGKSITCNNVARHIIDKKNKVALYLSIEMESIEVLQRDAAIATRIPFNKIRNKNLSVLEWEKIVDYWASRFKNADVHVKAYREHRCFDKFHTAISKEELADAYLDIVYDPHMTLTKIRNEVMKRINQGVDIGIIIVDYINQVKLRDVSFGKTDQYDWKEQIDISTGLRRLAQELRIPVFSPFQIDKTGAARFAKGILDAPTVVMNLIKHPQSYNVMQFVVTKMRHAPDELQVVSVMDWSALIIGPENGELPVVEEDEEPKGTIGKKKRKKTKPTGEPIFDDNDIF